MMTSFYWSLLILFVPIGLFQIYLVFTEQHIHFHYQNTSSEKRPEPTWRNGRAWFTLYNNDESKGYRRYPSPTFHPWWHLFHRSGLEAKFYTAGDEHDFSFFFEFLFGQFGFSIEGIPFFYWLFKDVCRMGFGYCTGVDFNPWMGNIVIELAYNDMSSGPSVRLRVPNWNWLRERKIKRIMSRKWDDEAKRLNVAHLVKKDNAGREYLEIDPMPTGFTLWRASDWSKDYPTGGGFYFSIDFNRIILGSYEREVENLGEAETREIPIEPDNTLGLHYFVTFQRQAEVRWRGHFPWRKKRAVYWEIETNNPPLHAGKGENSYDLDDDGIFGCAVDGDTVEEAVAAYQEKCARDRKKYGMPNAIDQARRGNVQ